MIATESQSLFCLTWRHLVAHTEYQNFVALVINQIFRQFFCHFWFSPQRWLLDQERGVSVVEGKQLTVVQPPAEAAAQAIPLPQPAAVEAAEEALPHIGSIFPGRSHGFRSSAPICWT